MAATAGLIFNIQKYSIHDGPGIRTTVFFKGCPLQCKWCSNPESQNPKPQQLGGNIDSRQYAVQEVVDICLQDRAFYEESGGGVTLSGGEPLTQPQFAFELLNSLKAEGIHTAIETTGYVAPDLFSAAAKLADLLLFDVKHCDTAKHRAGTGVGTEQIDKNFRCAITAGANVLPRVPVIPGFNDSLEDARNLAIYLDEVGATRAQLLPFHQMGDQKYVLLGRDYAYKGAKPLYPEDLKEYQEVFVNRGIDAFF